MVYSTLCVTLVFAMGLYLWMLVGPFSRNAKHRVGKIPRLVGRKGVSCPFPVPEKKYPINL